MEPNRIALQLDKTKETKGTYVYGFKGDVAINSLYIKKTGLPTPPPETIKIVVTW